MAALSRNVYTSTAILRAWYHCTRRKLFYSRWCRRRKHAYGILRI